MHSLYTRDFWLQGLGQEPPPAPGLLHRGKQRRLSSHNSYHRLDSHCMLVTGSDCHSTSIHSNGLVKRNEAKGDGLVSLHEAIGSWVA